jgi:hypothetical protein
MGKHHKYIMALLNSAKTPLIWTWARAPGDNNGPENRIAFKERNLSIAEENWIDEIDRRLGDYYYIEFVHHDAFSVYDITTLIPDDILARIKLGEVTLILATTGHGYHENVEGVYRDVLVKHSIDPKNIIIRSESADMLEEINVISRKYNLPVCRYEWATEFERMMQDYPKYTDHIIPVTLQIKEYEKKFLSFNGLWRPHRGAIVNLLSALGVLDKGFVSYNSKGSYMNGNDTYEFLQQFLGYNTEVKNLLENTENALRKLDKLIIDIDETSSVNAANILATDKDLYENSYFSVVTETSIPLKPFSHHFESNTDTGRILSEKIFKPVALRHPFLVVSNPKTLDLFRSLGYKTFSPLIDESYDDVDDTAQRLLMIAKEVKRLCELTPDELAYFLTEAKKICDYNLDVMTNKKYFIHPLN